MKKFAAFALILLLLAGCKAAQGVPGSSRPTEPPMPAVSAVPAPAVEPTPAPVAEPTASPEPTPRPVGVFFDDLPVTEEAVRNFITGRPDRQVVKVTPYEGDFLVEWTDYDITGKENWASILSWVFGESGRVVRLTEMEEFDSYEIRRQGQIFYTTGTYSGEGWQDLPGRYEITVPGGAWDNLSTDMSSGLFCYETDYGSWINPAQSLRVEMFSGRYEQLYDARIDADGLSFTFIPDTASMERFQSFIPACTSTPGFETSYDEAAGVFTLRLYNTSLESGEYTQEMSDWIGHTYDGMYPCAIPEGSLGRDNHFMKDVSIRQDGEDAVITAKLTEKAGWFTLESGNLGYDNIPWMRLVFRERDSMEVMYG